MASPSALDEIPSDSTTARTDLVAAAAEKYQNSSWPVRTDERWRFATVGQADVSDFLGSAATVDIERSGPWSEVEELSLEDAVARFGGTILQHLTESLGQLGAERYLAAAQQDPDCPVQCFAVPEGVELSDPLVIETVVDGQGACSSGFVIMVGGKGSRVHLLERFRSASEGSRTLHTGGALFVAEAESELTHVLSQELSLGSKFVHASHGEPRENAHWQSVLCNFGAGWVRQEVWCELARESAHADLFALNMAGDGQEIDQRTRQQHAVPKTTSDLLYKNALFGKSKATFGGLIRVAEGAHQTDAFQTCRSLLLSDDAEVNAMPGLEINADQVRCSHGATSGRIDEEEIFYLRARGLDEEAAKRLIISGFAADLLKKIGNSAIEEILMDLVRQRLEGLEPR